MAGIARLLRGLGRLLQPLFDPDAEWRRDRLEAIASEQRGGLAQLEKRLARQEKHIARLRETIDELARRDIKTLRGQVTGLGERVRRELLFNQRVLRRLTDRQQEFRAEKALDRLARLAQRVGHRDPREDGGSILVGPWTGEVGFELIYWAPFVRWFVAEYGIDPRQLTIYSRGGTQAWYAMPGSGYVDIFELATP